MSEYRSTTQVSISTGTHFHQVGHAIGVAAVLTRFIELYSGGEKETVKQTAEFLMKRALSDIDNQNRPGLAKEDDTIIRNEARAMIQQILLPLAEAESVQ